MDMYYCGTAVLNTYPLLHDESFRYALSSHCFIHEFIDIAVSIARLKKSINLGLVCLRLSYPWRALYSRSIRQVRLFLADWHSLNEAS